MRLSQRKLPFYFADSVDFLQRFKIVSLYLIYININKSTLKCNYLTGGKHL